MTNTNANHPNPPTLSACCYGSPNPYLDLPVWMIERLDHEAKRIGVARQAIMKMFLAERLEHGTPHQ